MMERVWSDILDRFGQAVTLHKDGVDVSVQAFIQPYLDEGTKQEVHGPLGLERRDRFRYLGPVRYPIDLDTLVEWDGRELRVQAAHLVGEPICPHWWAVLYPREEEAL